MIPDPVRDDIYAEPEDEIEHARNRFWTGWTVLLAALALAFTNARSIERWAAVQPPGWSTETARLMADLWTERMEMAGFNTPRDLIRTRWDEWKQAEWEDVPGLDASPDD